MTQIHNNFIFGYQTLSVIKRSQLIVCLKYREKTFGFQRLIKPSKYKENIFIIRGGFASV